MATNSRGVPEARLTIVGKNPGPATIALQSALVLTSSEVPDVRPYLTSATALAVPLTVGGGTRLKILEAFAAGVPVVSTAIGAEGIAANPGQHFYTAPPEEFAAALLHLLTHLDDARLMAERARQLAISCYDWNAIGDEAAAHVAELM